MIKYNCKVWRIVMNKDTSILSVWRRRRLISPFSYMWCASVAIGVALLWSGCPGSPSGGSSAPVPRVTPNLITTGTYHSCMVMDYKGNKDVALCWGGNASGQLGDNSTDTRNVPVPVHTSNTSNNPLSNVRSIVAAGPRPQDVSDAANRGFTCAIIGSGSSATAICWGDNSVGQLGNNDSGDGKKSTTPVEVTTDSYPTAIAAGGQHACAIVGANETAYCWGNNRYGQLGNRVSGQNALSATPVAVYKGASGSDLLTSVKAISSGANHNCAIVEESGARNVYCWGRNAVGQLGNGSDSTGDSSYPLRVRTSASNSAALTNVIALAVGSDHACAIVGSSSTATSGPVHCWGNNSFFYSTGQRQTGQLGVHIDGNLPRHVNFQYQRAPYSAIKINEDSTVTGSTITSGLYHSCIIDTNGRARCWGHNASGELGNNGATAISWWGHQSENDSTYESAQNVVDLTSDTTAIAGGGVNYTASHSCAIHRGVAKCWGSNVSGQLGIGVTGGAIRKTPVTVQMPQ